MLVKHAARTEKSRVKIVKFQQIYKILAEHATRSITIRKDDVEKEGAIWRVMRKSTAILLKANATAGWKYLKFLAVAKGIEQIKEQLTPEYIYYLIASGWDGRFPLISGADGAMILDLRWFFDLQQETTPNFFPRMEAQYQRNFKPSYNPSNNGYGSPEH